MSEHDSHEMHENSLKAYEEERQNLSKRATSIYGVYLLHPEGLTDRQVCDLLGLPEPNCVRPRVTELLDAGFVVEVGKTVCATTGKTVRLVAPKDRIGENDVR